MCVHPSTFIYLPPSILPETSIHPFHIYQFMPMDNPGHVIAIWRDPNDISELEVFQDALEVPGLHEVFLLATLLLAQSHPIGDFHPAEI